MHAQGNAGPRRAARRRGVSWGRGRLARFWRRHARAPRTRWRLL